jgi:hypothetical protein
MGRDPFCLALPRAGAESASSSAGGVRPFCGKPAGQLGLLEMDGEEGVRGRTGPLPLPLGGMFCEFTRPYPTLPVAMMAGRAPSPGTSHMPHGISQTFHPLPTEFHRPETPALTVEASK